MKDVVIVMNMKPPALPSICKRKFRQQKTNTVKHAPNLKNIWK